MNTQEASLDISGDEVLSASSTPAVQVCVRLRPLLAWERSEGHECSALDIKDTVGGTVTLRRTEKGDATGTSTSSSDTGRARSFRFDAVFGPDRSQQEVWDLVRLRSLIEHVVSGFHVTIFAYGQTGSGKTHTMEGFSYDHHNGTSAPSASVARPRVALKASDPEQLGVVPRAIQELFSQLEAVQPNSGAGSDPDSINADGYTVKVSFLQIYKERIFDLLNPMHTPAQREAGKGEDYSGLRLRWDAGKHQFFVENLFEYECATAEDVMQHYSMGIRNKQVASTAMNVASSRSHTILVLTVTHRTRVEDGRQSNQSGGPSPLKEVVSKLALVDLAGSERSSASANAVAPDGRSSARFQEAININQSLFVLRKVITALSKRSEAKSSESCTHIPYRESKLTSLLQHAIGGNSFLVMFACLSPSDKHFEENLSTLQYAAQAASIKNVPTLNLDPKDKLIQKLKDQLAMAYAYILRITGLEELPAELLTAANNLRQRSPKRRTWMHPTSSSSSTGRKGSNSVARATAKEEQPRQGLSQTTPDMVRTGSMGRQTEEDGRKEAARRPDDQTRPNTGPGVVRAPGEHRRDPQSMGSTSRSDSAPNADTSGPRWPFRNQPPAERSGRASVEGPPANGVGRAARIRPPSMPPPSDRADTAALPPIPSGESSRGERKHAASAHPSPYMDPTSGASTKGAAGHSSSGSARAPQQRRGSGGLQPSPRSTARAGSRKEQGNPGDVERPDGDMDKLQTQRPVHDAGALLDALRLYQAPQAPSPTSAGSPPLERHSKEASRPSESANKEWSGLWEAVEELRQTKSGLEVQLQMAESRATELQAKLVELEESRAAAGNTLPSPSEVGSSPCKGAQEAADPAWVAVPTSPSTSKSVIPADGAIEALAAEVSAKKTHLADMTAERDQLRGENAALRHEQASLLERLEIFEKLMEMEMPEGQAEDASRSFQNGEHEAQAGTHGKVTLRDKAESFHARLIMEAAALRKEVASLKKKKWIVRSLLANGGEQEKKARDEEVAELRRSRGPDVNTREHAIADSDVKLISSVALKG